MSAVTEALISGDNPEDCAGHGMRGLVAMTYGDALATQRR